jgi:hypothetical protein
MPKLDWKAIQAYYDNGHTMQDCLKYFGFCNATWAKAAKRGDVVSDPKRRRWYSNEELFIEGCTVNRHHIKKRILLDNLINYSCAICGLEKEWNGLPIVLRLDHINGINDDYRIDNLRFVCPNCDSQLDTFCGRNVKSGRRDLHS